MPKEYDIRNIVNQKVVQNFRSIKNEIIVFILG
jgi:hypothetical protein